MLKKQLSVVALERMSSDRTGALCDLMTTILQKKAALTGHDDVVGLEKALAEISGLEGQAAVLQASLPPLNAELQAAYQRESRQALLREKAELSRERDALAKAAPAFERDLAKVVEHCERIREHHRKAEALNTRLAEVGTVSTPNAAGGVTIAREPGYEAVETFIPAGWVSPTTFVEEVFIPALRRGTGALWRGRRAA